MLIHPQFDPVALSLGPLSVHWYGLMYLLAFLQFWWLVRSSIDTLHAGFSSIYVDLYEEGGSFVPHTDRPIYGPYVLGMSFGVGSCEIVFSSADSEYRLTLPPRSVYCFGPPLRNEPWVHEVVGVTGRRFGVTFRTEAP